MNSDIREKDKEKTAIRHKIVRTILVWLLRIIVGSTFIFSGFVKTVDPWGFVYKIQEYLNVWGIDWLWHETIVCIAVAMSTVEFIAGVLMLTGCLRRTVSIILTAFMAIMLPLTAYILIADPVADCGCFGDVWIISNTATFLKNVVLTIAIIYLLFNNAKVSGLFQPLMQWMVFVPSLFYCLIIAIVGISIQPMIDFRQFKVGTQLIPESDTEDIKLTYSKDGITRDFELDELPDSTWNYIGRSTVQSNNHHAFAVFDGDDDVTNDVIETEGPQMLLIVPDENKHRKARASMANNINDYIMSKSGSMIGIVGTTAESLPEWISVAKPHFDVYTSDDTSLKELVRGDAGLVYLQDGKIVWKRNLYSLPGDFPDFTSKDNVLDKVKIIDDGSYITSLTYIYIGLLFLVYLLGLIRIKKDKKKVEKQA